MTNRMQLILDSKESRVLNFLGNIAMQTRWERGVAVVTGRTWSGESKQDGNYLEVAVEYDREQDLLSAGVKEYSYGEGREVVTHYYEFHRDTSVDSVVRALRGFNRRELTVKDIVKMSGVPNLEKLVTKIINLGMDKDEETYTPSVDSEAIGLVYSGVNYSVRLRMRELLMELGISEWVKFET